MTDGGPFGTALLVPCAASEIPIPVNAIDGGFRWYEDDSGDEVGDEILAWAATDETKSSRAGT